MDLPNPAAISRATTALPFTLTPIIQDLVRTRFPVPGSIFLIEDIQVVPLAATGRWQVVRLVLSDGELCIQAVLGDAMHRFVHNCEIRIGSYIRADELQLHTSRTKDRQGSSKETVFLVVHDLKTVGCNHDVQKLHEKQNNPAEPASDKGRSPIPQPQFKTVSVSTKSKPRSASHRRRRPDRKDPSQDTHVENAFEGFEAFTFPVRKPRASPPRSAPRLQAGRQPPIALPRDWHDVQTPLKLTTLRAVPNLPYHQNWSCNILAIVASLSPVETSQLLPYKQRTARITDPSTAKQVHLTVFLDPEGFEPKVGSAVLLTGVKNHRYDGGSLKKYASDKSQGRWWFEDPWELPWCDVRGIKSWWAEMEAYFTSQASDEIPQ